MGLQHFGVEGFDVVEGYFAWISGSADIGKCLVGESGNILFSYAEVAQMLRDTDFDGEGAHSVDGGLRGLRMVSNPQFFLKKAPHRFVFGKNTKFFINFA